MKLVIITCGPARGGVEEYALNVARYASGLGWDLFACFPFADATRSMRSDYEDCGVECVDIQIASTGNRVIRETINFARAIARLWRHRDSVVLLNQSWPGAAAGVMAACGALRIPTAVVFHLTGVKPNIHPWIGSLMKWSQRRNQRWVAVSDFNRKNLCESIGLPVDEVEVIYNGIDLVKFQPPHDRGKLRAATMAEFAIPDDGIVLFSCGRLHWQKGFDLLLDALATVAGANPKPYLIIAGDGPDQEALTEQATRLGIADRVRFAGFRSDVSTLLGSADVFVFPTRLEGLPFALLEAMRSGTPIITSNSSSIPELMIDGVHGRVFCSDDADHLSQVMSWALSHSSEMSAMADNAFKRSCDFGLEASMKGITSVLGSLLPE